MYEIIAIEETIASGSFDAIQGGVASEAVSEVASVFTSVMNIVTAIPGWSVFFGVGIVTLIGGVAIGIVSGFLHRK